MSGHWLDGKVEGHEDRRHQPNNSILCRAPRIVWTLAGVQTILGPCHCLAMLFIVIFNRGCTRVDTHTGEYDTWCDEQHTVTWCVAHHYFVFFNVSIMNSKPWQELLITYDSDKSEMSPITSHHCWFLFTTTIIICPPHRTLSLQPHITYPIP